MRRRRRCDGGEEERDGRVPRRLARSRGEERREEMAVDSMEGRAFLGEGR